MKKVILLLLSVAVLALAWYLFITPYDFRVNFKAKTLPGDVIETLRIWNRSLDNAQITDVDSLSGLTQKIVWKNSTYVCQWDFRMSDDSTTKITAKLSEPGHGIMNKILVPFTLRKIEEDGKEIGLTLRNILNEHLKITRVEVVGEEQSPTSFCICTKLSTNQTDKANGMMHDYNLLTSVIADFHLEVSGPPIVKINEWNHNNGKIKFDFCFPISENNQLPHDPSFSYQKLIGVKSLKAIYHGNYITSDRAWYALMKYAQDNGYQPTGSLLEFFRDNPTLGYHEESWRADIYLPIK
jgi:hypothetical protein